MRLSFVVTSAWPGALQAVDLRVPVAPVRIGSRDRDGTR